jgi:uncharacterized protein
VLIFLLVFLTVYGSLHLYFFLKLKAAFALAFYPNVAVIFILVALMLAPVGEHLLEGIGQIKIAKAVSWIGYCWMGILFLFFSSALCIDLYRLLLNMGSWIASADLSSFKPSARLIFLLPLTYGLVIFIYGLFEGDSLRTERITIKSAKIPSEIGRFTIAQITDIHSGINTQRGIIAKTVAILEREKPDMIVSTGDLFDSGEYEHAYDPMINLKPKYGKFAVTGNHEFYAGLERSLAATESAGFRVLRGDTALVGYFLTVVGVDDPAVNANHRNPKVNEIDLLTKAPSDRFTLFLKHQPRVDPRSVGKFDLMLSGHTHKGQIFPFNLLVKPFYTASSGLSKLASASQLYVSRGTGNWGPPIRFLAPPEVTIIEIVSDQEPFDLPYRDSVASPGSIGTKTETL